jgi:hypothetical protein
MENNHKGQPAHRQERQNKNQNTNSEGLSAKMSDAEGNTKEMSAQTQSIPGNQTDQPTTEGKTIAEATDPSKLSDL